MENLRNSHPKPIMDKKIGEMTFSEFSLSVVNLEFNYKNDTYRVFGWKYIGKFADTTTFFVKNNNTQEEYKFEAILNENDYISSLKAQMIHCVAQQDKTRQYDLPEYAKWVDAYNTFINDLTTNN